jgi:hypothetical protein
MEEAWSFKGNTHAAACLLQDQKAVLGMTLLLCTSHLNYIHVCTVLIEELT